jgi:hypothetical protein
MHGEKSDAFIVVNSSQNDIYVAEAGAVDTIVSRTKVFRNPQQCPVSLMFPGTTTVVEFEFIGLMNMF